MDKQGWRWVYNPLTPSIALLVSGNSWGVILGLVKPEPTSSPTKYKAIVWYGGVEVEPGGGMEQKHIVSPTLFATEDDAKAFVEATLIMLAGGV